jgi:4-amino-4-deoxy-L-arabinose transferase-like glycosyltransferase
MLQSFTPGKNFHALHLFALTACALVLVFARLGENWMPPIDDCYFSQKAKEMVQTGDWSTLRFAGKLSLDHAPLYIWLIALMFKLFGVNEFSARFFSAAFGVATIVGIYFLGKMLFDKWVGLFSSFVLLTTEQFFIFSRRAMVDTTFTFWITLALIFFLKGLERKRYFLLFGVFTGLAIVTKSVLGFFPIVIVALYLLISREFRRFVDPYLLTGISVALLVGLPWFLFQYVRYRQPFVGGHLQWLIYEGAIEHQSMGGPSWYLQQLFLIYWPWIPLATYSFCRLLARNVRKIERPSLIILCWTVAVLGVMSFMNIKKQHYMMSVLPALAILTAMALNSLLAKEKRKVVFTRICLVFLLVGATILVATPVRVPFEVTKYRWVDEYWILDDVCSIAMFARDNIPKEEKAILYRMWLWRLRSTYLFYSDRDLVASVPDTDSLLKRLRRGNVKYCLAGKEGFYELSTMKASDLEVLKETPSLVLLRAAHSRPVSPAPLPEGRVEQ